MEIPRQAHVVVSHDNRIQRVSGALGIDNTLREIYDRQLLSPDDYRKAQEACDESLETIMRLFKLGGVITETYGELVADGSDHIKDHFTASVVEKLGERRITRVQGSANLLRPFTRTLFRKEKKINSNSKFVLFDQRAEENLDYEIGRNGAVRPILVVGNSRENMQGHVSEPLRCMVSRLYWQKSPVQVLPDHAIVAQAIVDIANNWGQKRYS